MKITLDDKARDYLKKQGVEDVHVYVKGCSA
ncbi:hypothetical protein ABB02_01344 [Clostridiaceae bacterium JG1575]|nr:hypothetical protein ABB02_01344 [Clostridiaceae bacterium JG1575]